MGVGCAARRGRTGGRHRPLGPRADPRLPGPPPPATRARRSARSGCSTTRPGVAVATGAELVVVHPGFLLGRSREEALEAVVEQLAELGSGSRPRIAPCRSGSRSWAASASSGPPRTCSTWPRSCRGSGPVIDFAHLHAVTDGAFTDVEAFAAVLEAADDLLEPEPPSTFTSATSGTRTGTRIATCRTARARCAPSRSRRPSRGSSGRPR